MEKRITEIQVEEFQIEESVVGQELGAEERLEKRRALLEKLCLKEQQKMFAEDVGTPYQRLTRVGINIWHAFCPHVTELNDFKGYIPTRVLEIVEQTTERFDRMEVWSEEQTNPDPVLVGVVGKEYSSNAIFYLLARWGESLLPYGEVVKIAKEKWLSKRRNKLNAQLKKAERDLAGLDADADAYFDGNFVAEIY